MFGERKNKKAGFTNVPQAHTKTRKLKIYGSLPICRSQTAYSKFQLDHKLIRNRKDLEVVKKFFFENHRK
jgi:hypothetical protein